jgi:hypothetical protein
VDEVPALLGRIHDEPDRFIAWQGRALARSQAYARQNVLDRLRLGLLDLVDGKPLADEPVARGAFELHPTPRLGVEVTR